jgi:hypothetical protein
MHGLPHAPWAAQRWHDYLHSLAADVTTGPPTFVRHETDQRFELEPNPNCHGPSPAGRRLFLPIPTPEVGLARFETGGIMLMTRAPGGDARDRPRGHRQHDRPDPGDRRQFSDLWVGPDPADGGKRQVRHLLFSEQLGKRAWPALRLMLAVQALALLIAVPIGVLSARNRCTWPSMLETARQDSLGLAAARD